MYDMLNEVYGKEKTLEKKILFVLSSLQSEHHLISNEKWCMVSNFITIQQPFWVVRKSL